MIKLVTLLVWLQYIVVNCNVETIRLERDKVNSFHSALQSFEHFTNPSKVIFKEKSRYERRSDLRKTHRAERNYMHEVIFAVKQRNIDKIEKILNEVSDPRSAKYGQHLTRKEVSALTTNHESNQHILSYLQQNNVEVVLNSKFKDFITAKAPIHVWESIFSAQFYEFEYVDSLMQSDEKIVRALEYSVSEHLNDHVSAVFNTVQLPLVNTIRGVMKPHKASESIQTQDILESGNITPDLLINFYDITTANGSAAATQGVYADGNNYFSPSDLAAFQNRFKLYPRKVSKVINGHNSSSQCVSTPSACYESNLDLQYLMAVSQLSPTTYHYYKGSLAFLGWILEVADQDSPELVQSISFGFREFHGYDSYFSAFNTEAIKLGAIGVTILASSGDDGAVGHDARTTILNCGYNPNFPASSPYVTAIGGTMGPETGTTEIVCSTDTRGVITTGGGFSELFDVPDWQSQYTSDYLELVDGTGIEPAPGYVATGRGIPDISLAAENYQVFVAGNQVSVSGTSASCPAFAGMISLINGVRLKAGKSAMGWINPALYAYSDSFVRDITSGNNKCTATGTCCAQGFTATTGWDPLTGLGSVTYSDMLSTFASLGNNLNIPTLAPTPISQTPTVTPTSIPTPGVTDPSEEPTISPSEVPSEVPTAAPTHAPGWLGIGFYSGTDCEGSVQVSFGVQIDRCYALYNNHTFINKYIQYSCSDAQGFQTYYSDSDCSLQTESDTLFSLGCATTVADDTAFGVVGSADLFCTSTLVLPIDRTQYYITERGFDNDECDLDNPIYFKTYLQDTCVNSFGTITKASTTQISTYSSMTNCGKNSAASIESIQLNQCKSQYSTDDSELFEIAYTQELLLLATIKPTFAPTVFPTTPTIRPTTKPTAPTIAPTVRPTFAPTFIQENMFTVTQNLIGITRSDYNVKKTKNNEVFCRAVASCMTGMNGMSYRNISVEKVSDVTTVSSSAIVVHNLRKAFSILDSSSSSEVNVEYDVTYNIGVLGYTNPDDAYDELKARIDTAISSHLFDQYLSAAATTITGSDLDGLTSTSVTVGNYTAVVDDGGSNDSTIAISTKNLIIIGISIAAGLGLFCVGLILAFFCNHDATIVPK